MILLEPKPTGFSTIREPVGLICFRVTIKNNIQAISRGKVNKNKNNNHVENTQITFDI